MCHKIYKAYYIICCTFLVYVSKINIQTHSLKCDMLRMMAATVNRLIKWSTSVIRCFLVCFHGDVPEYSSQVTEKKVAYKSGMGYDLLWDVR